MKILIITDIHYGEDTNYPQLLNKDYISSFGSQFEKYLPKIKDLIKEHDLTINLGDLIVNSTEEIKVTRGILKDKIISLFNEVHK